MPLRAVARFLHRQLLLLLRDRQLLFWNVGFFVMLLVIFLGPLSGGDDAVRVTLAAGLVTTQVMSNALFGLGVGIAAARERGVFRRYAVTPAPGGLVLGTAIAARGLLIATSAAVMVGLAAAGFGVPWTGGASSWIAIVVLGTAAFAGLGFVIAAHARAPHVANAMANLVFIPMLALGGTALPATMMPTAWAEVHWVLPTATMFDGLLGAFVGGETVADNLPRLGYLGGWAAITLAWAAYQWRRRGV